MAISLRSDPFFRPMWRMMDTTIDRPLRIFDQYFGNGLLDEDLWVPPPIMYNLPRIANEASGTSEIQSDKDKYQVMLDVQHFKPEEVEVKTVGNSITIKGHHEEKQDQHGFISRSFTRRYVLPDDVKVDHLECNLSTDGVLTIKAPRVAALENEGPRAIPIVPTGKPAVKDIKPTENGPAAVDAKK